MMKARAPKKNYTGANINTHIPSFGYLEYCCFSLCQNMCLFKTVLEMYCHFDWHVPYFTTLELSFQGNMFIQFRNSHSKWRSYNYIVQ